MERILLVLLWSVLVNVKFIDRKVVHQGRKVEVVVLGTKIPKNANSRNWG